MNDDALVGMSFLWIEEQEDGCGLIRGGGSHIQAKIAEGLYLVDAIEQEREPMFLVDLEQLREVEFFSGRGLEDARKSWIQRSARCRSHAFYISDSDCMRYLWMPEGNPHLIGEPLLREGS